MNLVAALVFLLGLLLGLLFVRRLFPPGSERLRLAEAAARKKRAETLKQAEAARKAAMEAFDVEAVEARIRRYSSDVAAVFGGLGDDALADSRFDELRRDVARWAGKSARELAVIEADFRAALDERPYDRDLAGKRRELEEREAVRDAARVRVDNRGRYLALLRATFESIAPAANARFAQIGKHLDAALAMIQEPSRISLSAALTQLCHATRKRAELRAPLDGESPLEIPLKEGELFRLPAGERFGIRRFGLESRSEMKARLTGELTRAVDDYEAEVDELYRAEVEVSRARKRLEVTRFAAELHERDKDHRWVERFSHPVSPAAGCFPARTALESIKRHAIHHHP